MSKISFIGKNWVFSYREHERFTCEDPDIRSFYLRGVKESGEQKKLPHLRLMGMDYDFHADQFFLSYYVGTDWVDKATDKSILVTPKIKGIDFQKMFMICFSNNAINDNLENLFFIRTNDTSISIPNDEFQIEPLIIIYYINLVRQIVGNGLRKDYVQREEHLKAKVKGKILLSQFVKHGLAKSRNDIIPCRFEEQSVDCLDNRILKKALQICKEMIIRNSKSLGSHKSSLTDMLNAIMPSFENVNSNVTARDLERVRINNVFKLYKTAIQLAKMIIRKNGFCVDYSNDGLSQLVPPFIIDMPLLFERYVYGLLVERYGKNVIGFQERVKGNIMDFSKKDEHMVIDTKYIPTWEENIIHDNIRQLSGYARNISNRKRHLRIVNDSFICPCLIVYPNIDGAVNLNDAPDCLASEASSDIFPYLHPIEEYVKFYKLSIKLPIIL